MKLRIAITILTVILVTGSLFLIYFFYKLNPVIIAEKENNNPNNFELTGEEKKDEPENAYERNNTDPLSIKEIKEKRELLSEARKNINSKLLTPEELSEKQKLVEKARN